MEKWDEKWQQGGRRVFARMSLTIQPLYGIMARLRGRKNMPESVFGLRSGEQIKAQQIVLYPRDLVSKVFSLRSAAAEKMSGFSTGLGFWGSPGWAIGGAVALGAIEGIISKSAYKDGLEILSRAARETALTKRNGQFISVEQIAAINLPNPEMWESSGPTTFVKDFRGDNQKEIDEFCDTYNIIKNAIYEYRLSMFFLKIDEAQINFDGIYVHDGDKFVVVRSVGRIIHIKWDDVSSYEFL